MAPSAPALFSTSTGCPTAADTALPRMREIVSVAEPAGNGTMILMGLFGYWADAMPDRAHSSKAASRRVMGFPPRPRL